MKLKYTIIGLLLSLIIIALFGNLDFISDPNLYCNGHIRGRFPCQIDFIVDLAGWISQAPFAIGYTRVMIWIATIIPILVGLLIDIKTNKNDNNLSRG
jgi:prepilin signal peptidase PulO-like enzyme (type II secretory pathway)